MTHESGTQLTASRIELASKCPGSQAHEHVQRTNDAAERGAAIHEYIAALLSRGETALPSNYEARAVCERLDKDEILRAASPTAHADYRVELGLYLSPASGNAGILEGSHHRDYSAAPEGSIPGTADVVALEDDRVRVTDWKTGAREVPHPAENHQLRFLGLVAARAFGRELATAQIAAIREDGSIDLREADLGTEELDEIATELAYIARRVKTAREGDPVYKTGNHCRYCPALPHCPAIATAGQAILDGPPEDLTPKRAAEMWSRLQAVEAAAKKTREALQEYTYARPIPTEDGKQLKVIETRRENIDSGMAFAILREHLPDETLAEVVSVTKTSLSGGLGKDASNDAMAAFREAGAITETYSESLREVRSSE
jgi:hypothetical protein